MPEHRQAPEAVNQQAVRATIQRIKAEITSHPNPETLNEIRAAFRREIPLHLRSYAAALLILEASGAARSGRRNEGRQTEGRQAGQAEGRRDKGNGRQADERKKEGRKNDGRQADGRRADGRKNDGRAEGGEQKAQQPRGPEMPSEETRPRFRGEGTTIFFGMGKRQRLYPRVLLRILTEEGGLSFEEIGDIRSFDNYSFADLDPLCADSLIATLDGKPFRGRGLPVSKARKRGAAGDEETQPADSGARPTDEGFGAESDEDPGYAGPESDEDRPLDADEGLVDEGLADEGPEGADEDSAFDDESTEDLPGDENEDEGEKDNRSGA